MLDDKTRLVLKQIENRINEAIDDLIILRCNCHPDMIKDYRYTVKKLEHALGMLHKARDRADMSNYNVDTLDTNAKTK
jgi:hypothetical protein